MSVKNRSFNIGRQSEHLMNEELFRLFESIRPLLLEAQEGRDGPESETQGALWLDQSENELKTYDKVQEQWKTIFHDKFRITDELLSEVPPLNPLKGQLWINQTMLWYFTGQRWESIKAFDPYSSEVYFSSFEDFLLLSPMQEQSNRVVDKDDEGNPIGLVQKSQFLTPSLHIGRFYIDNVMRSDYEAMNQVALQYPSSIIDAHVPSWVHVNPGRLTEIKKRIFRIHKDQSSIDIPTDQTEFYGYKKDSPLGHFLRPVVDENEAKGDYYVRREGILLTIDAVEKFDYVLAITYKFSWIKTTGVLRKNNTGQSLTEDYYIGTFSDPINVFLEGLNLENEFFYHNKNDGIVNIDKEMVEGGVEVDVMRVLKNEYGVIQKTTMTEEGIIRLRKYFKNPLIIVNGLAHHQLHGDIHQDREIVLVKNARAGMTYSAIELERDDKDFFISAGVVDQIDPVTRESFVSVPDMNNTFAEEFRNNRNSNVALFVDGLLVRSEELAMDYDNNRISARGLAQGQQYVLLHRDDSLELFPALDSKVISTGKVDESLVFMNGYLLCNDTAVVTTDPEDSFGDSSIYGELKQFVKTVDGVTTREYKEWNNFTKEWVLCDSEIAGHLDGICFSYENAITAIIIHLPHTDEDVFETWGYSFAHTIENPVLIYSYYWDMMYQGRYVSTKAVYAPRRNALQVYLSGVRMHTGYEEVETGDGFWLASPFAELDKATQEQAEQIMEDVKNLFITREEGLQQLDELLPDDAKKCIDQIFKGTLTYVIENPEKGAFQTCDRIFLDKDNVLNTPNVYRSEKPLYPGWVTVYVNGLRMPAESFTILDNYTIKFKDKDIKLIGHSSNYPTRTEIKKDDPSELVTIPFEKEDVILIEVRKDYNKQEKTYIAYEPEHQEISISEHNLPPSMLEAQDEILIYINGLFTGYKHNYHYRKDLAKGVITLLDDSFTELINYDPVYTILEENPAKKVEWEKRHGGPYHPRIRNTITLEWR